MAKLSPTMIAALCYYANPEAPLHRRRRARGLRQIEAMAQRSGSELALFAADRLRAALRGMA